MTLNLAQKAFKVIHLAAIVSPCTTLYRPLIVAVAFFNRLEDIAGFVHPEPIFPHPSPVPAKMWGVSFGVDR